MVLGLDNNSDNESTYSRSSSRGLSSSSSAWCATTDTQDSSPAPSVAPFDKDVLASAYRKEHGRRLNNYSDVYKLPADEEELERLDDQHVMLTDITGAKYSPAMSLVMADDVPGEVKACLDLGCGSGSWILDVARDFPHCQAVAIDLVPLQVLDMPSNLRSEVDDINLGLEHFYGDFNVVHASFISSGIKDYRTMIDQIAHVLRPGGLVDLTDFDFHIYDEHHQRIEHDATKMSAPWTCTWMAQLRAAINSRGGDPQAATRLLEWVSANPHFEDVEYKEYFLPFVPHPETLQRATSSERKIHDAIQKNFHSFLKGSRVLLLSGKLEEAVVDDLLAKTLEEVDTMAIPNQFTRMQCVTARKKHS